MAFTASRLLNQTSMPPGRSIYFYDIDGSVDDVDDVEAAGYFSNLDQYNNFAIGDHIDVREWSAVPHAAGSTITNTLNLIVTNVVANSAAASAGKVNTAQRGLVTSLLSSLL